MEASIRMVLTLTPRNHEGFLRVDTPDGHADIWCKCKFFNVFIGMHQIRFFEYLDQIRFGWFQKPPRVYVEESLESLWEEDRLLIVQRRNYENDTNFGESYYRQNIVQLLIHMNELSWRALIQNNQIGVTFDIEPVRNTEAQLFLGFDHYQTFDVTERRNVMMIYVPITTAYIHLRPVKNEIYFNSVDIEVC